MAAELHLPRRVTCILSLAPSVNQSVISRCLRLGLKIELTAAEAAAGTQESSPTASAVGVACSATRSPLTPTQILRPSKFRPP